MKWRGRQSCQLVPEVRTQEGTFFHTTTDADAGHSNTVDTTIRNARFEDTVLSSRVLHFLVAPPTFKLSSRSVHDNRRPTLLCNPATAVLLSGREEIVDRAGDVYRSRLPRRTKGAH